MSAERINYNTLPNPIGPYCHAVKHNNTLYLSGLTAFGTDAEEKSSLEQAKAIFEQLHNVTVEEQISLKNLIRVTVYVTELTQVMDLRQLFHDTYGEFLPASTLVQVSSLFSPTLSIEITATLSLS